MSVAVEHSPDDDKSKSSPLVVTDQSHASAPTEQTDPPPQSNTTQPSDTVVENAIWLEKLEEEKIIQGYSVRLNHELLGFDITAIIEIKTNKGKMLDIENEIAQNDNVVAVYDITGDADMMIIAKFKNRELLSEFIKKISAISNVENTLTHLVLNTIKEDNRLIE